MLLLGAAATISVFITVGIIFTLVEEGAGFWDNTSVAGFLTGTQWFPNGDLFGVLPLLSASLKPRPSKRSFSA